LRAASKVKETEEKPVVLTANCTYSLLVVAKVAPTVTLPFEPQESVPSVKSVEVIPTPGEAEAVTVDELGTGEVVLNPAGNVHCAIAKPHTSGGVAGALFTVNEAVADRPVSSVSTKRLLVVLL